MAQQPSEADCYALALMPKENLFALAEGRIGGKSTYELDLQSAGDLLAPQRDVTWANGVPQPFALSFVPSTGAVTFSITNVTLENSLAYPFARPVSDLFLRTSVSQEAVGASVSLTNLLLSQNGSNFNFSGLPSEAMHDGNLGQVSYVWLSGIDAGRDWTLTGDATFNWGPAQPRNSHAAFQISMGSVPAPLPESGSLALAGVALVGLTAWARRRRA